MKHRRKAKPRPRAVALGVMDYTLFAVLFFTFAIGLRLLNVYSIVISPCAEYLGSFGLFTEARWPA